MGKNEKYPAWSFKEWNKWECCPLDEEKKNENEIL
jgi:hypothetical protein